MRKKKEMRIVFMGTPEFAVAALRYLVESGRKIVGVITAPDKKSGRGQQMKSSAVKQYAQSEGLTILQPSNLKSEDFIETLRQLKADIQIVVAFRMLPKLVWDMPALGTMNLHASLLPNYRGAAPINWAIINNDKETGLTTFFLKHQIDTGDMLLQETVEIEENETAGSLHDKLMHKGGPLLEKSLKLIESGDYQLIAQSTSKDQVKAAPKIFKADCKINWNKTSVEIDAFIRGLSPYPAAWTMLEHRKTAKKKQLKIYEVKSCETAKSTKPAQINKHDKKLYITSADGQLEILTLQLEGKKKMASKDLLNGFPIEEYKII